MNIFNESLDFMGAIFHKIESKGQKPILKRLNGVDFVRYENKTIVSAIILKVARLISGLRSSKLLLQNVYIQELNAMFRMVNEFTEDINFRTVPNN